MPDLSHRRLLGAGIAPAAFGAEGRVNVYSWDSWSGENTVEQFAEATGIRVRYERFGKHREGNPGYAVCFRSNNVVERMIRPDMPIPSDRARIPNLRQVAPLFDEAAHEWGTRGIGFGNSAVSPEAWAARVQETSRNGRIALLDDPDVIRKAPTFPGHSPSRVDPAEIEAAGRARSDSKPSIERFATDTVRDLLHSGAVDDIGCVVPEEGALLRTDSMGIPKGAPHPCAAHAFIDDVLTPAVHGRIASETRDALPNDAAQAFIPEADRDDPQIHGDAATLDRCGFAVYLGDVGKRLFEGAPRRVLVG